MAPRRQDEDDMTEDQLSYLPGSGPSVPDFGYEYPPPTWIRYCILESLTVLEREFDTDPKPNADKRRSLAAQLNMTPRAIQVWFQNRRAKIKAIKNKIPGGRGMPKLKPSERAAARAKAAEPASPSEDRSDEPNSDWVQLSPEESPTSSPGEPAFPSEKPQFTISVPPNDGQPVSDPTSPSFPAPAPGPEMLAPPSAAAMLRRGSAPAPLQGIHRARYSVFNNNRVSNNSNELEVTMPPVSPISPPDHEVAPVRRPSAGLGRRPSLPDSHLRLPAHPYYPHSGAPRMQRRTGLLSPVPDVGQEQESQSQYPPLPTMLPPAPALVSSRMYKALPPGMGAVPAAHDLPTQLPARPVTTWTPQRPFEVPVAGPLPAPDFSFGAPEPGHGDAFNRVMNLERENSSGEFTHSQDFNHSQEFGDFSAPQMWDARTRFGSMASIASDVTGVSVSSTQATSVSGGLGTATFNNPEYSECPPYGYPSGFQPDLRRASCPGEFLHQFSGMGVTSDSAPARPSPLGRSLTIAPDSRGIAMVNDAKSLRSPTFPPGQVDPTYPPPPPEPEVMVSPNGHGQHQMIAGSNQQMMSPTQMSPTNQQPMISPANQSMMAPSNPSQSMISQQSLVGGGFGNGYEQGTYVEQRGYASGQDGYRSDQSVGYPNDQGGYGGEQNGGYTPDAQTTGYTGDAQNGYTPTEQSGYPSDSSQPQPYIHTPPSFETSPAVGSVPVLGPASTMEIINLNGMESKDGPMLFADGYEMMMHQEYVAYS
ncbi:hypothetical protein OPQ81_005481 [Rhizoctonia solani]|nr:hypothetical protein OPQ81_005481 [Rhizoctonia solani]